MLVTLNGEFAFEQGVIDGFVLIEVVDIDLPQLDERLLDENFFGLVGLVGVIV